MSGGSVQLRTYRRARRDGATLADACAVSNITPGEAKLIDAEDAKFPPPPEAFEPLGHNSRNAPMSDIIAADQLRLLIERIERLESEKSAITDDIKDVYGEAKSTGFDTKTIRKVVARRKAEAHHLQEADAMLATYCAALGMQMSFDL